MIRSHKLLALFVAIVFAMLGLPGVAAQAQGTTWFQVQPMQGIQGFDWAPGGTVDVSWNAPTPTTVQVPVDGNGQFFWQPDDWSNFPSAGAQVVVTDGVTTHDLTVSSLWVTLADSTTDVVAGIANPGDLVRVSVFGHGQLPDPIVAGPDGRWSVDLGSLDPPIDLVAWQAGGGAEVRDSDGDATSFNWAVPTPFVRAHLWGSGAVYSHGWLPASTVTLQVDKPGTADDLTNIVTADVQGTVVWELPEGSSINPGDIVRGTSEDGLITREVVVTDFGIDTVSLPSTVIGHAPAGTAVNVYVGESGSTVTADEQGAWSWNSGLDLRLADNNINADMRDSDGDWIETSFYVRDHLELGSPGPSDGMTYGRVGAPMTYWDDVWVAYPAAESAYTVTWNWGDGTTSSGTFAFDQGDPQVGSVYGTHSYRRVGLYLISVTVSQAGIPAATSSPNDGSFASVYDPKRPTTVSGSATVTADAGSGGYYDLGFTGGDVNLTITASRAAKTGEAAGSATVHVAGMNGGTGMTFTGTSVEYLYSNPANRLGNEVMLFVHGTVNNALGPDTAAGAMIHLLDRARGTDLLRITIRDEGGAGYPILDTSATAAPGEEPPWTAPFAYELSSSNDQTTATTLRVK